MTGTVVGILRGGPSREHDVSLKTGHAIAKNLHPEKFTVKDIYIDRNGVWHDRGRPVSPAHALRTIDVAVVGLHGEYGEDGEVQKILEAHGVPYTGSEPFPSYMAMHKVMAKERAKEHGVLTPKYRYFEAGTDPHAFSADIVRSFQMPVVVKPVRWGSSVGVSLAHGYHELLDALTNLLAEGAGGVLVEERIRGREATAGVVEGLRGESLYRLPPVEIIPEGDAFYSFQAKYSDALQGKCPGNFSKEEKEEISRVASVMHEALGLRHYSRSDFMVSPRGVYYLETNSLPDLLPESEMTLSLKAIGVELSHFLEHLTNLALKK